MSGVKNNIQTLQQIQPSELGLNRHTLPLEGIGELSTLFREPAKIKAFAQAIRKQASTLPQPLNIMEVCGGHTHNIYRYGLKQLLIGAVNFVHGPGCPVCILPKERIDHAITIARQPDTILVTLGDMIRVPGSTTSLQGARAEGLDIRFVYSPIDALTIAHENSDKTVVYFAIGFETTTPMTAVLIDKANKAGLKNLLVHINHVLVPPPLELILADQNVSIDAFIAPSHVSVITGANIFSFLAEQFHRPVVVGGFEPVDILESIWRILTQAIQGRAELEIQYSRNVGPTPSRAASNYMDRFFTVAPSFRWRGLGDIKDSALQLRSEYAYLDAEYHYTNVLSYKPIDDHKMCLCGDILKGKALPTDCKVFGTACRPERPLGACMVSSEGACQAAWKYQNAH